MSHEMLRETFRCEPEPTVLKGQAEVNYAVGFEMGYPLGVWGGTCTCPDGRVYTAGDNGDICNSIACFGGVAGPCNEREGIWAFREVHCAPSPPRGVVAGVSANTVVTDETQAGLWGGTCTCPDGEVFLVGDQNRGCDGPTDLACEFGTPSECIHNKGSWSHRKACRVTAVQPPGNRRVTAV